MAAIEAKVYRSRPFRRGDEVALVDLYNAVTGRGRTLEQHRWEWLDPPDGPGSMWVIEATATGAVVGHHGLIPIRLRVDHRTVLAGKTENSMVHPEHRGKILYFLYERQFATEAKDRFDVLFTTSGAGTPGRIRRKLGYRPSGTYAYYLKATRRAGLHRMADAVTGQVVKSPALRWLLALITRLASTPALLVFSRNPPTDAAIAVQRCDNLDGRETDFEALWRRTAPELGITVERTPAYLRWRLFNNPNVTHICYIARRGRTLVGFAAVERLNAYQAVFVDLVAERNDPLVFDTLLQGVLRQLEGEGISVFIFPTLLSDNALNSGLRRNGFRSFGWLVTRFYRMLKREQPMFLIKAHDPTLDAQGIYDPRRWYYTMLFAEGVGIGRPQLRVPGAGEY